MHPLNGTSALSDRPASRLPIYIGWALLLIGIGSVAVGFLHHPSILTPSWAPAGQKHLLIFAAGYVAVIGAGWLFARRAIPLIIALAAAVMMIGSVGIAGPAAAGLFILSATALGARLIHRRVPSEVETPVNFALSFLLGASIYLTLVSWTAALPIHYAHTYFVLLALPLLILPRHRRAVLAGIWSWLDPKRREGGSLLNLAAFATAMFFILLHLIPVLLPQVHNDATILHLAAPSIIASKHYWPFDLDLYVISVMPMGVSWFILPGYLIGGEYAARLLNFFPFVLVFFLLFDVSRRYVSNNAAWLIAAVYASTPMMTAVTANVFAENLWVALLFGGCLALDRYNETRVKKYLDVMVILLATSIAVKTLGLIAVAAVLLVAAPALLRQRSRILWLLFIGALFSAFPYINAFLRTGNPLFPFMNQIFRSPYYPPVAFTGLSRSIPKSLYEITFSTSLHFDGGGKDGSLGFAFLVLLPLCLMTIWSRVGYLPKVCLVAALTLIVSIMAFAESNIRYFYPALPLLMIVFAAALAGMQARSRALYFAVCSTAAVLVATNAAAIPVASWAFRDLPLRTAFLREGLDAWRDRGAPERRAIDYLNLTHGENYRAAFFSRPMLIDVKGAAVFTNWYNKSLQDRLSSAKSPEDVRSIMRDKRVSHFISFESPAGQSASINQFLAKFAEPEFRAGDIVLSRWNDETRFSDELVRNGGVDKDLAGWTPVGRPKYDPGAGIVTVTSTDAITQEVPIDEHSTYRYALEARCPLPNTRLRLQVMWRDANGAVIDPTVLPLECPAQFEEVSAEIAPPNGAKSAVLYVTGHEGTQPVEVTDISMRW